jgi:hypothetical protein
MELLEVGRLVPKALRKGLAEDPKEAKSDPKTSSFVFSIRRETKSDHNALRSCICNWSRGAPAVEFFPLATGLRVCVPPL